MSASTRLLGRPRIARLDDGREYRPSTSSHARSIEPSAVAKWVTRIILVLVLLYFLFPLYWLIISATKTNAELKDGSLWLASNNIKANYDALISWTGGMFWRWVANSVLYSTAAGVIGTLVSVMAGYGISKFAFRGSRVLQLAVLGGLLLPIALLTIPLYIVMHTLGLTDTVWAIIIPSCVSPFGVFLGRMYAATSVPDELLEAARIDGAGEFRIFFTMVLRILAPAMVTIFLFIFVATWNNFLLPLMMVTNNVALKPVTLGLYGMMSYFDPTYGAVLQGALLGVLPLVILFLILQRYWKAGLTAGAVKG
ncbi:MAG: carbohydrate ABC transporter permease [Actinomyces urogenitalis]|uniref:carbohydrate ABC transporter permease n=1 Tax=Actinomyces urogenitalis TaxID=103621 RepID=UPI00242E54BB|nr:carbohydrate ABC transporter permease [Actinomyces urogenitalis]MCI7457823.1 carbohydrate ABC transporter permease [Actinomyces urogenitalis]MDY3678947.1 carbohydrate ABC transporter permease [Actinomyces urogenitalis]